MDTFIFDHVRTPRGRGKAGGSLHEVTPVWLASRPLVALAERNRLDTAAVEEVVMGCVGPVGEQGGNIGRIARHVFVPETGAVKDFVSGYSNALSPNLWARPAA